MNIIQKTTDSFSENEEGFSNLMIFLDEGEWGFRLTWNWDIDNDGFLMMSEEVADLRSLHNCQAAAGVSGTQAASHFRVFEVICCFLVVGGHLALLS